MHARDNDPARITTIRVLHQLTRQWWWRRGSVLAYGTEGPGFDSRSRLNFFRKRKKFGLHIEVSTFSSVTPTLDVGLFFSHLFLSYFLYLSFPVQFARDTIVFFLPSSSLLTTYASCTKDTNVLCSNCALSLSLLRPSYQDETGAARLQWRQ